MAKTVKERVQELEKKNRLLIDNLADSIWILDSRNLTYEYITSSVYNVSGYRAEELINTSIADRLTEKSKPAAVALLKKELENYKAGKHVIQLFELELKHKNGGTYWTESKAKLVEEPDGSLKIVGISRNVTSRKKAEQQLEKKNRELALALAEKEKLLKDIKMLQELLPICSGCKRIRDENGKWWPLDIYVTKHTDSNFTHTICRDCKDVIYPNLKK